MLHTVSNPIIHDAYTFICVTTLQISQRSQNGVFSSCLKPLSTKEWFWQTALLVSSCSANRNLKFIPAHQTYNISFIFNIHLNFKTKSIWTNHGSYSLSCDNQRLLFYLEYQHKAGTGIRYSRLRSNRLTRNLTTFPDNIPTHFLHKWHLLSQKDLEYETHQKSCFRMLCKMKPQLID